VVSAGEDITAAEAPTIVEVAPGDAERAIAFLRTAGEDARIIGEIVARAPGAPGAVVV